MVEDELLPWVLQDHQLGDDLLEVGPGPGLTTDILRRLSARVTAAELDEDLAEKLRPGGVLVGSDGLDMPGRRQVHQGAIFAPVDPAARPGRLRAAGFAGATVEVSGDRLRCAATAAA